MATLSNEFITLVSNLMSPDNGVRTIAEQSYKDAKKSDLNFVTMSLVQLCGIHPDTRVRSFGAILIRDIVKPLSSSVNSLSIEVISMLKTNLISIFLGDPALYTKRQIGVAISMLASKEQHTWPELLPTIFNLIMSGETDVNMKACGFDVLGKLSEYAKESLLTVVDNNSSHLLDIFKFGLTNGDIKLRFEASKASCIFISSLEDKNHILAFQGLLEPLIGILNTLLQSGDETSAQTLLKCLVDVGELVPDFMRAQLTALGENIIGLIGDMRLEVSTRTLCMELMNTIGVAAPGMMRKEPVLVQKMIHLALSLSTDLSDEWNGDIYPINNEESDDQEDNGDANTSHVGQEALARLSDSLGSSAVLDTAIGLIANMLKDTTNWKNRYAAIEAISLLSDTCKKNMQKMLPDIVNTITPFINDPFPRVRYAVVECFASLVSNFKEKFIKNYHSVVFPLLINVIVNETNVLRVKGHAAHTIITVCQPDTVTSYSIIAPYMEGLMGALSMLLSNAATPMRIKETVLLTVGCIASVSKSSFDVYYDSIMPFCLSILGGAVGKEHRTLRGSAMQTIGLIAESVGAAQFAGDARGVMDALLSTYNTGLEADDPQLVSMLQACTRICSCLKAEFMPYMDFVLPPLLQMAQQDAGFTYEDLDDDGSHTVGEETKDGLVSSTVINIKGIGLKKFSLNTVAIQNIVTACNMIYEYANELDELFMPFVEQVANVLVPLIKFKYYEGVRSSAALCAPKLLSALVNGLREHNHPQESSMTLLNYVLEPLLEQLKAETDEECRGCLAEAISQIMMVLYESGGINENDGSYLPAIVKLPDNFITPVVNELVNAAKQSCERRVEAEAEAKGKDWDEEAQLALEESLELEVELMEQIVDAHGYILKAHGAAFLPAFKAVSFPFFQSLLAPTNHHSLICNAVCVFDDLIEFFGEGSYAYLDMILPILMNNATSQHPVLRQASIYGLSQASKNAVVKFRNIAPQALQIVVNLVNNTEEARSEEYENATDNAIAAIGNILEFHGEAISTMINVAQLWTMWLSCLPLQVDEIETLIVTRQLVNLVENGKSVIGVGQCNLPLIMNVLSTALIGSNGGGDEALEYADVPTKDRIGELFTNMKKGMADPNMLQQAWSGLSPKQQEIANQFMSL